MGYTTQTWRQFQWLKLLRTQEVVPYVCEKKKEKKLIYQLCFLFTIPANAGMRIIPQTFADTSTYHASVPPIPVGPFSFLSPS